MKKAAAIVLTICLAFSMVIPAFAEEVPGMQNFKASNTYNNQFTDMAQDFWATPLVELCYKYGLMNGTSASTFSPKQNLSVAQAIVMADRIHEIYNTGKSTLANGTPWYQPYVDYALENGIIAEGDFTDYTANVTRAQMAQIFFNSVPENELYTVNSFNVIPDVPYEHPNARAIHILYGAGVLTGNDEFGTFYPDRNITRAEAAAIISRIALTGQRKHFVLMNGYIWDDLETGEELVRVTFPQIVTMSEEDGTVTYTDGDAYVSIMVSDAVLTGVSAGQNITDIYTIDEISDQWETLFAISDYVTVAKEIGERTVFVTAQNGSAPVGLYAIDFMTENRHVKVLVTSDGMPEMFEQVVFSISIYGNKVLEEVAE